MQNSGDEWPHNPPVGKPPFHPQVAGRLHTVATPLLDSLVISINARQTGISGACPQNRAGPINIDIEKEL
jgi:hypothetical protein